MTRIQTLRTDIAKTITKYNTEFGTYDQSRMPNLSDDDEVLLINVLAQVKNDYKEAKLESLQKDLIRLRSLRDNHYLIYKDVKTKLNKIKDELKNLKQSDRDTQDVITLDTSKGDEVLFYCKDDETNFTFAIYFLSQSVEFKCRIIVDNIALKDLYNVDIPNIDDTYNLNNFEIPNIKASIDVLRLLFCDLSPQIEKIKEFYTYRQEYIGKRQEYLKYERQADKTLSTLNSLKSEL